MAEFVYTLPDAPAPAAPAASSEGTYSYSAAHATEMVNHLIEFFRKPRNSEVLRIVGGQIQAVEDAIYQVYQAFDIDSAVGLQLDYLGAIVGEQRNGRLDTPYRTAVGCRILANISRGTLPELETLQMTADPSLVLVARELYPASVLFKWTSTFSAIAPRDLMNLVQQAKPAGVRIQAIVRNVSAGFRWSTVASAGSATSLAFATVSPGGDGGLLERVL